MRGTQTKTLNPELDAEFGGRASLNATLADVDNRRSVSSMMGSGSGLDSAPSKKSQALAVKNWMEQNSGYWVLFVYNEQFVNRYMVPAVEFVRFFRATSTSPAHIAAAYEAARRYVVTLANDPDVRQMPCIQPANVQFLIPFSERTATDVRHVPTKLARLQARQDDVVAFRREDFKRAKDGDGSGGVMEESEFHIWKNNYLATKRTFDFNDTDPDAVPASVAVEVTSDHGQVDVGGSAIDLSASTDALVERRTGEGRFRWLHAHPGEARALLERASTEFESTCWVMSRRQVVTSELLGEVDDAVVARLGDVAVIPHVDAFVPDPAVPLEHRMRSRHGSLTRAEMLVPLCVVA